MNRRTLPWVLGTFLMGSVGIFGCSDTDSPAKPDASGDALGGTGGKIGTGGTGGHGPVATGGTAAETDAGDTTDTLGEGTGGAPGTGGAGDSDAAAPTDDTAPETPDAVADMVVPTPDTAPVVDMAPAGSTVMVTSCGQIVCPDLVNAVSGCYPSDNATCARSAGANMTTSYCYSGGIKKQAVHVDSPEATTMAVKKADGSACYTLVVTYPSNDVENWTYKSPTGTVLGTAVADATGNYVKVTITCGGVNYVINTDDNDCPGTDGEPSGSECPTGSCTF